MATLCSAITQRGTQCRRLAVRTSDRCRQHGGQFAPPHVPGIGGPAMSVFCSQILPALQRQAQLMPHPDPRYTTADGPGRWAWVEHEQAFCQLTKEGQVAVSCACSGCAHDPDQTPVTAGHDAECECPNCVCMERLSTGRWGWCTLADDAAVVAPVAQVGNGDDEGIEIG
jgi:hypothetical protein